MFIEALANVFFLGSLFYLVSAHADQILL